MSTETSDSPTESERADRTMHFSMTGVREGFIECIPIALSVAGYGIAFGVLAAQAGVTVAEAAFMSATVLAGAAQLIAIELWAHPIPVGTIVATTFIVNLRYVLMGAALQPWFSRLSPLQSYGSVFFTADENWALTMGEFRSGSRRGAFLLGSGLAIWIFWISATVVGAVSGAAIGDPARYGLDFALTAVFIAIAVELWDGRSRLLPWVAAFGVAIGAASVLPGRWYILLGGLAGCFAEVVRVAA
ncbi:AzlC family ABC transporter permease [Natrialba taiwanensis]|uniref:AzlC family protein n=1 Tax=Natrialba taiwanensis DSM 12281 TaxID=1230458 RepID=M0ADS1_9EURY|nr:AzlC family ABC transporter permease [Natrialba taiwanensis]ELY95997.1 AzlC family protein [Natrialba taiwanensis DSM 12281]